MSEENINLGSDKYGFIEQLSSPKKGDVVAIMETTMGTIKLKFFPNEAPKAVENFVTHSKNGYYNGIKFHRIINDFMIQGGDPKGTGTGGESIWGKAFSDEFSDKRHNIRGALSMANAGPNTNGSQFFIVQKGTDVELGLQLKMAGYPEEIIKEYEKLGGTPWLDNRHTVFGQVYEGMDVVDAIAGVEMKNERMGIPKEDVTIINISITTFE